MFTHLLCTHSAGLGISCRERDHSVAFGKALLGTGYEEGMLGPCLQEAWRGMELK